MCHVIQISKLVQPRPVACAPQKIGTISSRHLLEESVLVVESVCLPFIHPPSALSSQPDVFMMKTTNVLKLYYPTLLRRLNRSPVRRILSQR